MSRIHDKSVYSDEDDSGLSSMSSYKSSQGSNRARKTHLSAEIKEQLLSHKKTPDPFHYKVQEAFDAFIDHVEEINDGDIHDIDLPEVGLMLQGAAKIYSSQVDVTVKDVNVLLETCKRTKTSSFDRRRKKDSKELENPNQNGENENENTDNPNCSKDQSTLSQELEDDVETVVCEDTIEEELSEHNLTAETILLTQENSNLDETVPESSFLSDEVTPEDKTPEIITITDDEEEEFFTPPEAAANVNNIAEDEQTPLPEFGPQLEGSQESQNTLELDENGEPLKKKPRNAFKNPPELISCFDELAQLNELPMNDDDDSNLLPPTLEKMPKMKSNIVTDKDGVLVIPKRVREEKEKPAKEPKEPNQEALPMDAISAEPTQAEELNADINDENPHSALSVQPEVIPLDPSIVVKTEPLDSDELPDITNSSSPEALDSSLIPAAAANFSPEDQTAIQECINELHYLPFTFGLSKTDLANAFSKTVERMSQIFKKNNVQAVTRSIEKAATVMKSSSTESSGKPEGVIGVVDPLSHNLGDIYNKIVKNCREECESFLNNASAIMERTKEKSFSESRANIRAMIAELQRNIVPKFARVPLLAENTPEFFQHVTNFEKKMKKVLEDEAKKGEFDVRKYEREVLEVTAKESSELPWDEFLTPASPLRSTSIDGDVFDSASGPRSQRSSMDCSQSSCGGGSNGNSWVPIKNIFQNMKTIDRTETARSFYAVLALLSYQNLDINYDGLYSQESAALINKHLGDVNNFDNVDDMDSKYPRGVKICTSRCPDVDKEEVFVAALTAESRDEAFRQLLNQEKQNFEIRDARPGSSRDAHNYDRSDEGIAEAMASFVEEDGAVFTGNLHSKRRRKRTMDES